MKILGKVKRKSKLWTTGTIKLLYEKIFKYGIDPN